MNVNYTHALSESWSNWETVGKKSAAPLPLDIHRMKLWREERKNIGENGLGMKGSWLQFSSFGVGGTPQLHWGIQALNATSCPHDPMHQAISLST